MEIFGTRAVRTSVWVPQQRGMAYETCHSSPTKSLRCCLEGFEELCHSWRSFFVVLLQNKVYNKNYKDFILEDKKAGVPFDLCKELEGYKIFFPA